MADRKGKAKPPPKKPLQYTVEQVATALRSARGNVAQAARILQCHRSTVSEYMARCPELREVRDEGREMRLDVAEAALDCAVAKGEAWAVCFLLKTLGKARGYIERQEVEVHDPADRLAKLLGVRVDELPPP